MSGLLQRFTSPSGLLFLFVVFTQVAAGIYVARGVEQPPLIIIVEYFAFFWLTARWLRHDSSKHKFTWTYDWGLFIYIAWPIVLPYYLVKSRGVSGLRMLLAFVGVYLGSLILGIALYLLLAPGSWPSIVK